MEKTFKTERLHLAIYLHASQSLKLIGYSRTKPFKVQCLSLMIQTTWDQLANLILKWAKKYQQQPSSPVRNISGE